MLQRVPPLTGSCDHKHIDYAHMCRGNKGPAALNCHAWAAYSSSPTLYASLVTWRAVLVNLVFELTNSKLAWPYQPDFGTSSKRGLPHHVATPGLVHCGWRAVGPLFAYIARY